ncbi:pitrilysin family protein [Pedobacter sp. SYSU D00535]|uniref:M16 family metallopeptidase n=1 Tax=Pedobacter sp. SYSU D00535 TaxID=2810308 RepID=UPI001A9705AE|nr:pitrilysin family protein [Pedobacter sp. SYSU D00535]
MLKKFYCLLIAGLIGFSVQAQLPNSPSRLPSNMFYKTLPNGLDIFVVEDNSVPLATIELAVKNGAYTETPEYNGLSHLYEHMFFKANRDYPSQEDFLNRVSELGIQFNGTTSYELVNYYFTLPKFNLNEGLKFMNSAIRYPKFDKEEMAKENIVVDGEFQRNESNPYFALNDEMNRRLWGDLYSRKNTIGNHDVIRNATSAQMDTIKNKYYWPNNSLLTIAGDVKHEDVFRQVEAIFGDWKSSGFDPAKRWPVPEFKPLQKNDYFIVESDLSKVPLIMYNWHGPDTRTDIPATYAADVFSFILNQNGSKLTKSLVDAGLALQVNIGYLTQKHTGPISLFVVPNPARIKECIEEVNRQVALWDTDAYITDEQIETAKRQLEIYQVKSEEITSEFTHTISFWWASASIDYLTTYIENLRKVNRDDLKQYVRKYIKNKPYAAGMLISAEAKQQLKPELYFKAQ